MQGVEEESLALPWCQLRAAQQPDPTQGAFPGACEQGCSAIHVSANLTGHAPVSVCGPRAPGMTSPI